MLDCTFPFTTDHQLITDLANSNRDIIRLVGNGRTDLEQHFAQRVHELMRHRPGTPEF